MQIATIGLDIAKNIFQVHGADTTGATVLRKRLRRNQVLEFFAGQPHCLVGIEACATGHHWAREIAALGHDVRLLPPQYVKPYVKRHKNDAADAEAICEAAHRLSQAAACGLRGRAPRQGRRAADRPCSKAAPRRAWFCRRNGVRRSRQFLPTESSMILTRRVAGRRRPLPVETAARTVCARSQGFVPRFGHDRVGRLHGDGMPCPGPRRASGAHGPQS